MFRFANEKGNSFALQLSHIHNSFPVPSKPQVGRAEFLLLIEKVSQSKSRSRAGHRAARSSVQPGQSEGIGVLQPSPLPPLHTSPTECIQNFPQQ